MNSTPNLTPRELIQAALAHQQDGRLQQAETLYQQVLQQNPDHPDALYLYGVLASKNGKNDLAIALIKRSLEVRPSAQIYFDLGNLLQMVGRYNEVLACYNSALQLKPDYPEALNNRGNVFQHFKQYVQALADYDRAIAIKPDYPIVLNNRGCSLDKLGQMRLAIKSYRQALVYDPDYVEVYYNMGQTFRDMGEHEEAIASFDQALRRMPDHVRARWAYALTHIPLIINSDKDLPAIRAAIGHQFRMLDSWFNTEQRISLGYQAIGVTPAFYLAYQEENNRDLLSSYGWLCARIMQDWQQRHRDIFVIKQPSGPIKIGIVSSHIRSHSVWFALIKGWLKNLNRALIDIYVFSVDVRMDIDEETKWAKSNATNFENVGDNLEHAVKSILGRNLDILLYPEVGMEQIVQKLASLRLCPIQIVSWGHPETSGLPTIDYFLSAEDFEPRDASHNYSEKLVCLPHLGCCYQPLEVETIQPDFDALGLKKGLPLLIAPGVPFKYAPQHDQVFIDIVKKLGKCQIAFFISYPPNLSDKFKARLKVAFEKEGLDFDTTCIFIPWLKKPLFYGLMQVSDVFLDTIGFSGFNTAIQAVECGLPIVARDGRFMRGRLASGILRRMGLNELITNTNEDYVNLVVRLATDKAYQMKIRQEIEARRAQLFDDQEPIRALERLFIDLAHH